MFALIKGKKGRRTENSIIYNRYTESGGGYAPMNLKNIIGIISELLLLLIYRELNISEQSHSRLHLKLCQIMLFEKRVIIVYPPLSVSDC